jgi:hypothetical protein
MRLSLANRCALRVSEHTTFHLLPRLIIHPLLCCHAMQYTGGPFSVVESIARTHIPASSWPAKYVQCVIYEAGPTTTHLTHAIRQPDHRQSHQDKPTRLDDHHLHPLAIISTSFPFSCDSGHRLFDCWASQLESLIQTTTTTIVNLHQAR